MPTWEELEAENKARWDAEAKVRNSIREGMIGRVGTAIADVKNSIVYVRDYADNMKELMLSAIEDMTDVVGTYNFTMKDVDTNLPELNPPVMPATPVFGDLPIDWTFPDTPVAPNLLDYGSMDFSFVTPVLPLEISGNFAWENSIYTSEMWTVLFNKTHADILSGGTGIDGSVYDAIIAREQNQRRLNQDKEYSRALTMAGSVGFNLPSGHIAAIVRDVVTENGIKDQDALNNTIIKDFDLAQSNTHFAITTGADLEKLHRITFDTAERLGFEAKKAVKDYLIAVYQENIKAYLAQWDGVKLELSAKIAKIDAITAMNDGLNKTFIAQEEAFKTETQAITSKNMGLVETRKGEISVYEAEVGAVATKYGLIIEELKANVLKMEVEANLVLKEEELKLLAYDSKTKLADGVNQAVAKLGAQAVASALGAINTTMQESYHGSDSISHRGVNEVAGTSNGPVL